jgi:ABC-type branched-subunit amino acid transport system substrate-binding protein
VGGGILGRPVEVIYEDDKTDPVVAMEATRKSSATAYWRSSGRLPQET